jgi:hypothetical protein
VAAVDVELTVVAPDVEAAATTVGVVPGVGLEVGLEVRAVWSLGLSFSMPAVIVMA